MDADELYKKACGAVERGNPDYAIQLFMQILEFFPDHVQARKSLRATEVKRAEAAGYSKMTGVIALTKGIDRAIKIRILMAQKKYEKAVSECEQYLLADPKAVWVLKVLGESATKAGFTGAAQVAFENILALNKAHPAALEGLAKLYEEKEEYEQATKYLSRLKKARPNDRNVEKRIRDLAAKQTMIAGQWDKTDSDFKSKLKDTDQSTKLEEKQHLIRTDADVDKAIARLQTDLEAAPENNRLWRELGDLFRRRRAFAKAFEAYNRCLKNDATDQIALARIGDMRIQTMEEKIEKLAADDANAEPLAQLRKDKLDFSVKEFNRRVQALPTDMGLKFSLGKLLREASRFDEAISHFQAAAEDSRLTIESRLQLGHCFHDKGQHDLALRQYNQANDAIGTMNTQKKEALYYIGLAQTDAGQMEEAKASLMQIYEIDINFKDVAQRIESLNSN